MSTPLPLSLSRATGLCSLSALLLILAFPYARMSWLTALALVPYLLALRGQTWKRGALLGAWHGFLFQGYIMSWAAFFGIPAFLFLALYKTVLPACLGALLASVSRRQPRGFEMLFLLGWMSLEYCQTFGPFGVTWGMLSHAFARFPIFIQSCSLLGPSAPSLVLLLLNLALYAGWSGNPRRRLWWSAGLAALGANLAFGYWRLSLVPPSAPRMPVGVAQLAMGRDVKWDPGFAREAMMRAYRLSLEASQQGAQLVVWPETAIPYRGFLRDPNLTHEIAMLARQCRAWLLVGSIEKVPDDPAEHTLNTLSLVSPEGEYEGRYDKQRLVPGGEYLPLERWLRRYRIFDPVMNYAAGQHPGVVTLTGSPVRLGLLICFESMVPFLSRDRAAQGAQILVVSTNDGWFGRNPAIVHHFEMAIFRALEQGLPVVQSANTGISGMVDAYGRVLKETEIDKVCSIVAEVPLLPLGPTLYHRIGDLLPQACLFFFLLKVLRRKVPEPSS